MSLNIFKFQVVGALKCHANGDDHVDFAAEASKNTPITSFFKPVPDNIFENL